MGLVLDSLAIFGSLHGQEHVAQTHGVSTRTATRMHMHALSRSTLPASHSPKSACPPAC